MNLELFSPILQRACGLTFRTAGAPAVISFIEERMRTLGLAQPEEYQQRLEQDAAELQRLIETAAVPETWFNRDPAAIDTLVKLAKDRLAKNPGTLRILCLPCSTGEEAYSIAAALTGAGLTPEQFLLDAVDINGTAIAAAQTGEYKTPAFRKTPEEFRQKYFTPAGEETWKLTAEWKSCVNFRQGNMLQLETISNGEPYDFVFNRNLLIYFARPDQAKGLANLRKLLKPDGVIFVAAGEGGIFLANGFRTLRIPHAFAFRQAPPRPEPKPKAEPKESPTEGAATETAQEPVKAEAAVTDAEAGSKPETEAPAVKTDGGEPAAAEAAPAKPEPRAPRQKQPRPAPKQTPKEPSAPRRAASPEDTVDLMEDIKDLAEAGQMAEAETKLRGMLAGGSSDPDAHFLMGLLQDAQGDTQKAMATYRRVIQLDGNHPEALKILAQLLEEQGDKAEAERLMSRLDRPPRNQPRRQSRSNPKESN